MVEENGKTFEESLNELEKIATNLENGELGLYKTKKWIIILLLSAFFDNFFKKFKKF